MGRPSENEDRRGRSPRLGWRDRHQEIRALGALGLLLSAAACSLITSTSADQCSNDGDCRSKGGDFASRVCSAGVCVTPASAGGGAGGSSTGGEGGSAGTGGASTGGSGGTSGCSVNSDCTTPGSPATSICRSDHTCVGLLTKECSEIIGDLSDDNAIVFGFMGPLIGDYMSIGVPIKQGAELALLEIATNVVGLPGAANGKPRHVVMLACHDLGDPPGDALGVAHHLVDDVQVPAIIGPAFSGVTIKVASEVTIPGGTLIMSASATSPSLTTLPMKNGLVWRTVPSDAIQAIPISQLVPKYIEPQIRAEQMLGTDAKIKVVMSVKGDAYGQGLADAVTPLLKFNDGVAATDNGPNFVRKDYPDTAAMPNYDFTPIATAIVAEKPNLVIALGTNEAITKIMENVEMGWDTQMPPIAPRPHYLFPDGGRLTELTKFIGKLADNMPGEDLRKRVLGTVPGRNNPQNMSFASRYAGTFNMEPGTYANNAYDAAYLLAYAAVVVGQAPLTGASISAALGRMVPPGTPVDAGPNGLSQAFTTLQSGGNIDFNGASGPLDFDLATGEAASDITVWCVGRDTNGNPQFVSSGLAYDASMQSLVGVYGCM